MDGGAWQAMVHGVAKSQKSLSDFTFFVSFQVTLVGENPPANAAALRDAGSIPGSGRCPGGGHGNPFQYSCLENPMDRAV